jgi:hypothetical protein
VKTTGPPTSSGWYADSNSRTAADRPWARWADSCSKVNRWTNHVGVLEHAGLIHPEIRGREHWLSIRPEGLDAAERWISEQTLLWSKRAGALAARLAQRNDDSDRPAFSVTGTYLDLDPPHRLAFTRSCTAWAAIAEQLDRKLRTLT